MIAVVHAVSDLCLVGFVILGACLVGGVGGRRVQAMSTAADELVEATMQLIGRASRGEPLQDPVLKRAATAIRDFNLARGVSYGTDDVEVVIDPFSEPRP